MLFDCTYCSYNLSKLLLQNKQKNKRMLLIVCLCYWFQLYIFRTSWLGITRLLTDSAKIEMNVHFTIENIDLESCQIHYP